MSDSCLDQLTAAYSFVKLKPTTEQNSMDRNVWMFHWALCSMYLAAYVVVNSEQPITGVMHELNYIVCWYYRDRESATKTKIFYIFSVLQHSTALQGCWSQDSYHKNAYFISKLSSTGQSNVNRNTCTSFLNTPTPFKRETTEWVSRYKNLNTPCLVILRK